VRSLIAGAGYIGLKLAERLVDAGSEVFTLSRRGRSVSGAVGIAADLTDRNTLSNLPERIERVFYTASANGFSDEAYFQAYVRGLQNLTKVLLSKESSLQQILFTSSTGVYGESSGAEVDETSSPEPKGFSGRRLLEGEMFLQSLPIRTTAVRFGGIYGPQRTRLIDEVRSQRVWDRQALEAYSNRIHQEDCARVLEFLSEQQGATLHEVFIGVDDEPVPLGKVVHWIAEQLHIPLKLESARLQAGAGGFSAQRGNQRGNKCCINKKLRNLGFEFKYPSYREGFGALLHQIR
jgi:nucleoside-diphosphate-sugar epimerase